VMEVYCWLLGPVLLRTRDSLRRATRVEEENMRKARFTVASSTPSPFAVEEIAKAVSSLLVESRVKRARRALSMPLVSLVKLLRGLFVLSVQHINWVSSRWSSICCLRMERRSLPAWATIASTLGALPYIPSVSAVLATPALAGSAAPFVVFRLPLFVSFRFVVRRLLTIFLISFRFVIRRVLR